MGSKAVAVFLMCIVVIAAMHVREAQAGGDSKDTKPGEVYDKCYEKCKKDCQNDHSGYTFCEMKCDTDCGAKELAARLKKHSPKKE